MLEIDCITKTTEQSHQVHRFATLVALLVSKIWWLSRKLLKVFRHHPGRTGLPLHIAVLIDPLLRYSVAQAVGLGQAGATVTVYYVDHLLEFDGDETERAKVLDSVTANGITIVKLPPRSITRAVGQTRALLRDLRARDVTGLIVQAHFDPRYALASLRLPTLLVLHDPRPHSGDSDAPRWPAPLVARFAEATASCLMIHSRRLAQQIRPFLREAPTIVLPHGATIAAEPLPTPRSPLVLVTGRLFAYKGVDLALEAFPLVRSVIPDARLVIAGRGPLAAEAERQNLDGVSVEDGYVSEERLDSLLGQASVVLLPYRDATQSGVGLLAVGRGIPCVVSAQGALPDLLGPLGEHLVWSTADPKDLATAVVAALKQDDRFRALVHRRAAAYFAWDVIGATLISELGPFGFGTIPTRP